MSKLRTLIGRMIIRPSDLFKDVTIEATGRLSSMLALATGGPGSTPMYGDVGAGEGIHSLPSFLKAGV